MEHNIQTLTFTSSSELDLVTLEVGLVLLDGHEGLLSASAFLWHGKRSELTSERSKKLKICGSGCLGPIKQRDSSTQMDIIRTGRIPYRHLQTRMSPSSPPPWVPPRRRHQQRRLDRLHHPMGRRRAWPCLLVHVLSKLLFILKLTFCEDIVNVLAGELGNDLAQFFLIGINTDAEMEGTVNLMKNKTSLLDILDSTIAT